jgi:hypothetical protein
VVGDAATLLWGTEVPKTMNMARKPAEIAAHHLLALASGHPLRPFRHHWQIRREYEYRVFADGGAQTVMVKQGGSVLVSGA